MFCDIYFILNYLFEKIKPFKHITQKKGLILIALIIKFISLISLTTINNPSSNIIFIVFSLIGIKVGDCIQHIISYYFQVNNIKPENISDSEEK